MDPVMRKKSIYHLQMLRWEDRTMTAKIIASIAGILIGLCFSFLKNRNPRKILIILSISTFVDFVIYRTWAIWCDAYIDTYGIGIFIIRAIPLQLCYQLMIATLIGLVKKNRTLMSVGFLSMPLGGVITLLFPDIAFKGLTYLHPTYFMFMIIHVTMIAVGIGIFTMNVYHPTYADVPKVGLFLSMLAVETFIINKLFNLIGLDPNYMYTLGPNGNAALSLFYNMLPVPLLYTFLMILIFMGLAMIELSIIRCTSGIMTFIRNRRKE
jgi:uncharacterized membrane protein YwaF